MSLSLIIFITFTNRGMRGINIMFSDCIDAIECILHYLQCISFIGAGDYNKCFN